MTEAAPSARRTLDEGRLLALLAAVQFVNVIDFMMVMPLGPDFTTALDIPSARLGLVAGAYTASAAVTGLLGAFVLDRFDRRRALLVALVGLALGTLAGAFAQGLTSMLLARVVAGAFGGPATSLVYSIISDRVPPARRGRALGRVMGAFAVASVIGVPSGLFLAQLLGWQAPFVVVALAIAVAAVAAAIILPPLDEHLAAARAGSAFAFGFLRRGLPIAALSLSAATFLGMFVVVPSISPYIQQNLGFPRDGVPLLYMAGGAVSFFTMRLAGGLVDKRGATPTAVLGTVLFVAALVLGFAVEPALVPVPAFFVLFMVSSSFRMVPINTLTTRIPAPAERARYMSILSVVQHVSATAAAGVASALLGERADRGLSGMPRVAAIAIGIGVVLPFGIALLEPAVRRLEAGRAAAPGAGAPAEPGSAMATSVAHGRAHGAGPG